MQRFYLSLDENVVIQIKFLDDKNKIVFAKKDEKLIWSSSDESVLVIPSTNFDGSNYFAVLSPLNMGEVELTVKGLFKTLNGETGEPVTYEFEDKCQVQVTPSKVKSSIFTISHRIPQVLDSNSD